MNNIIKRDVLINRPEITEQNEENKNNVGMRWHQNYSIYKDPVVPKSFHCAICVKTVKYGLDVTDETP